jgi:hypothetical protein
MSWSTTPGTVGLVDEEDEAELITRDDRGP